MLGRIFLTTVTVTFLKSSLGYADYRAFRLLITNSTTGQSRTIVSVLDHIQYPALHPLQAGETITYVDSWRCWGNTSYFTPICPPPPGRDIAAEQKPKSEVPKP